MWICSFKTQTVKIYLEKAQLWWRWPLLTNSSSFDLAGLEFVIFVVTMALVISDQSECFICGRMDEPNHFFNHYAFSCDNFFSSMVESFVKLPLYSYSQWLEDYRERWRSIIMLVDEIPFVDDQAIKDMVSDRQHFSSTVRNSEFC